MQATSWLLCVHYDILQSLYGLWQSINSTNSLQVMIYTRDFLQVCFNFWCLHSWCLVTNVIPGGFHCRDFFLFRNIVCGQFYFLGSLQGITDIWNYARHWSFQVMLPLIFHHNLTKWKVFSFFFKVTFGTFTAPPMLSLSCQQSIVLFFNLQQPEMNRSFYIYELGFLSNY